MSFQKIKSHFMWLFLFYCVTINFVTVDIIAHRSETVNGFISHLRNERIFYNFQRNMYTI